MDYMGKRRYFNRILTGYIIIVLLYTFLFAGYFYVKNRSDMRESMAYESRFAAEQIVKNADMRFNITSELISRMIRDAGVYDFANAARPTYAQGAAAGEALALNISTAASYGSDVYMSKLTSGSDIFIGKDFIDSAANGFSGLGISEDCIAEIKAYSYGDNSEKCFVKYLEASDVFEDRLLVCDKRIMGEGYCYFISLYDADILFSLNTRSNYLISIADNSGSRFIISDNPDKATAATDLFLKEEYPSSEKLMFEGFAFTSSPSGIYPINYIYASSAPAKALSTWHLILITLVLQLILIGGGSCAIYFLTKKTYAPISQIIDVVSEYDEEKSEHNDEIEYIKKYVDRIGHSNENLMQIIAENKIPLKMKFFRDLLFGLVSDEEVDELIGKYDLSAGKTPLRVVIMEFSDYDLLQEAFSKEAILAIKNQINAFIREQLSGLYIYDIIEIDYKRFAIISSTPDLQELRKALMNVVMMIEGNFDVEIIGAIGETCDALVEICESYRSASHIMENRFALRGGRNAIVTTEDTAVGSSGGFYYPLDVERDLITGVVRLKRDEVKKILSTIFEENIDKRSFTKERQNSLAFAIASTLNRIVESMNKTTGEIFGEGNIVFLELKMAHSPEQTKSKVSELFETVMNYISEENKREDDNLSDQLLEYIHEHYNEDISLVDIGGHFNLSQCYISTLFKEATGENFKDYLSRYRIKKAKEILTENPRIKNNDLASMIGCNTVATLFRLFNKYEGMSPGQFVKNLNK